MTFYQLQIALYHNQTLWPFHKARVSFGRLICALDTNIMTLNFDIMTLMIFMVLENVEYQYNDFDDFHGLGIM